MASSRLRLLQVLKLEGPRTTAELAGRLEITPAGVRQHLQSLEAEGLVESTEERMPVGRPARRWGLGEASRSLFPDRHGRLAAALLESASELFGSDGVQRLIEHVANGLEAEYRDRLPVGEAGPGKRVAALADLRTRDGYMAESEAESEDRWLLVENHCPICTAATADESLCQAELALLAGLMGDRVEVRRIEHRLSGDRRCVYAMERVGGELGDGAASSDRPEKRHIH